jgi:hypothetical protein
LVTWIGLRLAVNTIDLFAIFAILYIKVFRTSPPPYPDLPSVFLFLDQPYGAPV